MPESVSAREAPEWARNKLGQQLSKIEREASKLRSEIDAALANLKELAEELNKKSEKDMEEKRGERAPFMAAKSVGKLSGEILTRLAEFSVSNGHNFSELRQIELEASRLQTDLARTRENWLRLIRPYYILDMMSVGGALDKLGRLSGALRDLLTGRGGILKELDDLEAKSDEIQKLLEQKRSLNETIQRHRESASDLDTAFLSTAKRAEKIRSDPRMSEVTSLEDKLTELRSSVLATGFVRLGRPLRKLESMSARGEYSLPPEVRDALTSYLKRPFGTLVEEDDGYPMLKSVLSNLGKAVISRKLSLKERDRRKVQERVKQVVERDSLAKLQAEAKDVSKFLADRSTDSQVSELNSQHRLLQKELREITKRRRDVELELTRTDERARQVQAKIESLCQDDSRLVEKLTGRKLLVSPN